MCDILAFIGYLQYFNAVGWVAERASSL